MSHLVLLLPCCVARGTLFNPAVPSFFIYKMETTVDLPQRAAVKTELLLRKGLEQCFVLASWYACSGCEQSLLLF